VGAADLAAFEARAAARAEPPLVMIRAGDHALEAMLDKAGWRAEDATLFYAAPVSRLALPPPRLSAFPHWPPLAVADEIWDDGGVGPARRAVMARAAGPKAVLLGRAEDRPAGVAFAAMHNETAMLHALHVPAPMRRRGVGQRLVHAAACWAAAHGAAHVALAVTEANAAARSLYASLGMDVVGHYHYRLK
jgi:GNAT superfamily N-acetyltransferase